MCVAVVVQSAVAKVRSSENSSVNEISFVVLMCQGPRSRELGVKSHVRELERLCRAGGCAVFPRHGVT